MKQEIFKELLARRAAALIKERVYVDDPSEVPEEYEAQTGEQGGTFYVADGQDSETGQDAGLDAGAVMEEFEQETGINSWTIEKPTSSWDGWPTSSGTEALWQAAEEMTGNSNAPEPWSEYTQDPLLEAEVDEETVDAVKEYAEFTQEKLREEYGNEVTLHRYIHGEVAEELREGGDITPRTLASWTTDDDSIYDIIRNVDREGGGVVVSMDVPVENILMTHNTNPEIEDREKEAIVALPQDESLSSGEVKEASMSETVKDDERSNLPPSILSGYNFNMPEWWSEREEKDRVYVDSPEEAPEGVQVQTGDQGGLWYPSGAEEGEGGDSGGDGDDVEWVETEHGKVPDTDGPIPPDMRDEPIGSDSHPVLWKRPEGEEELNEYITEIQDTEWYGEGSKIFEAAFHGDENTEAEHTNEDGEWDEERLEKHEEWGEELLNEDAATEEGEEPIGMILLGPPGAGKGWWQEQVEEGAYGETGEFVERDFTAISSDRTKEPIPEYDETNASEVHDEASKIAKENLAPKAIEDEHNVIVDKVATTPDSTLDMIDSMREKGYDVRANFVNVPTEKAVHNAVSRYHEEGRFTPLDYANGAGESSRESFNTILDEAEIPDEKAGRFDNDVEWGNAPEAEFIGDDLLKQWYEFLQRYKGAPVEAAHGERDDRTSRSRRDGGRDSRVDGGRLRRSRGGRDEGSGRGRGRRVTPGELAREAETVLKGRVYVDDPSEAPEDAEVQEGEMGGMYYVSGSDDEEESDSGSVMDDLMGEFEDLGSDEDEQDEDDDGLSEEEREWRERYHDGVDEDYDPSPVEMTDDYTDLQRSDVEELREDALVQLSQGHEDEAVEQTRMTLDAWGSFGYDSIQTVDAWAAAVEATGGTAGKFNEDIGKVPDETIDAMQDFMEICRETAREQFGEEFEVYRGYSETDLTQHTEKFMEVEDGEVRKGRRIQPLAMESWTVNEDIAEGFGQVAVKQTVNVEDVGFLSGMFMTGEHTNMQEVTLTRGEEYEVEDEDVIAGLDQLFKDEGELSPMPVESSNWLWEATHDESDVVEEAVDKVSSWLPLASESPDPERERVDAPWNEVEDEEELADKFLKRLLDKNRVYLEDPSDAPDGALVREGRSGMWYYNTQQTRENSPTRIYVSSPEEAPDGCNVRGGDAGGYYYYDHEHPRGQR